MNTFFKSTDVVFVNREEFSINDLAMIFPSYEHMKTPVHYYDGSRHYVSDGTNQVGLPVPYLMGEDLFRRIPELRMCKSQRENDNRYFENLRNGRK